MSNDQEAVAGLKNRALPEMADLAVSELKRDSVVLARNLSGSDADTLLFEIAQRFGLGDKLELQAGFAAVKGHRQNAGKYFMSVNKRDDYQFIAPHSEGNSYSEMQIASFFCYENSTDGGVTVLLNADDDADEWTTLLEKRIKPRFLPGSLSKREVAYAKALYQLDMENPATGQEIVLGEKQTEISGLSLVDTLIPAKRSRSVVADGYRYVYWDSISNIDHKSGEEYVRFLKKNRLYVQCSQLENVETDNAHNRRIWRSAIDFDTFFKRRVIYKLTPGDLIVVNNFTWSHSATNWTPGSGVREVIAAFA